ncbi:MAG: hypothetical protein M3R08_12100 [Bacteroidota bacterium]|nr:hypothetical protein [Bacteroidota bacterium]
MKQLAFIFSIIALIGVVLIFQKVSGIDPPANRSTLASASLENEAHEEEIEVAIIMGRIQRFHQKFWIAARAQNAPLAQFYLHEMEEAMEEIADAQLHDDGVDISTNMRTYGLAMNKHLQTILENQGVDQLLTGSGSLVKACNSCHVASGYEMIKIRIPPEDLTIPDQDMLP